MGLSWEELLRLAVRMEESGRDFYRTLAAGAKDPDTARILGMMAEEEEDHAAVFRRGLPGEGGPLPEEAERYLETLLSGVSS
ncbi:MAG: hypothetical protein K6U03_12185, partial [Firmicutes bacterium]|nr:hypothetical protein [Bacillota bacterium]